MVRPVARRSCLWPVLALLLLFVVVVSSPAPPNPIIVPVVKGLDAHISGLDPEAEQRVGGHVGLFATATYRLALQGVSFELSDRLGF
jgi:hypothetical protein